MFSFSILTIIYLNQRCQPDLPYRIRMGKSENLTQKLPFMYIEKASPPPQTSLSGRGAPMPIKLLYVAHSEKNWGGFQTTPKAHSQSQFFFFSDVVQQKHSLQK